MFNWPWRAWMPLFITLLIQALVTMALLTLPVMAPVVAKANGISPTLVGVYVSLSYIGAILASLMSGATVIRFGPIRVSQLGLLVCALGLALCAVPWLPLMVVGAVLVGLGYGPMTPASSHLLARSTPPQQMSLVFSLKQTGVPLGGMLAGAVVPPLLLWVDWQASLLIVRCCHKRNAMIWTAIASPIKCCDGAISCNRYAWYFHTVPWPHWRFARSCSLWFKCL
jgi:MFS family permease